MVHSFFFEIEFKATPQPGGACKRLPIATQQAGAHGTGKSSLLREPGSAFLEGRRPVGGCFWRRQTPRASGPMAASPGLARAERHWAMRDGLDWKGGKELAGWGVGWPQLGRGNLKVPALQLFQVSCSRAVGWTWPVGTQGESRLLQSPHGTNRKGRQSWHRELTQHAGTW